MMNIVNGGQHADNSVDVQEFMVMPLGFETFHEALRSGVEIFHQLKKVLKSKKLNTSVGDEGGFAPDLPKQCAAARTDPGSHRQGRLQGRRAGVHRPGRGRHRIVRRQQGAYNIDGRDIDSAGMVDFLAGWVAKYPICSVEDGCSEDDWKGWSLLTERLGDRVQLVGDDLFVTNTKRLQKGIDDHVANSILIKVNQIGTLTERSKHPTGPPQRLHHDLQPSQRRNRRLHDRRSGRGPVTGQIKTGSASRTDRMAKYNQLLRIEEQLGEAAQYGGPLFRRRK